MCPPRRAKSNKYATSDTLRTGRSVKKKSPLVQVAVWVLQLRVFSKYSSMSEMRSTHHDVVIVFVYIGGTGGGGVEWKKTKWQQDLMIQFIYSICVILTLKGNFEFYQKLRNPLGWFITVKTRTPGLCLTRFWDGETYIVARRNSITCAILSIPTESRFTNALERSLWTFTNSIIIATVTGNVGIFFDVWITEWQWIKIQVKDISSFLRMALSLFYLWVFPAYSRKEREGDSREKGFHRYYKKMQHCELIHFWWYRKIKIRNLGPAT